MHKTNVANALPVCIADLEAHHAAVPPLTLVETVVETFEKFPSLPGIMVMDRGRPTNVITRLKLFERLGHRYGIELFLRKPVVELNRTLRLPTYIMPGHMRIEEAVRTALQRPPADLYDPIVVELTPNKHQLLEINLLLTAQSQIVTHLSNAVNNIAQIDQMLDGEHTFDQVTQHTFTVLQQIIPHHQSSIALPGAHGVSILDANGKSNLPAAAARQFTRSAIYNLLIKQGDALYIPDTRLVPKWAEVGILGSPVSWLGLPIPHGSNTPAVLSIGRQTPTPFDVTEKETARAFARLITTLIQRESAKSEARRLHTPAEKTPNAIPINVSL